MATGRDQLINILQKDLKPILDQNLTKKEIETLLGVFINSIEKTLIENIDNDGFVLKLNQFAKLTIHHRAGILRLIPFNQKTTLTKDKRKIKFTTLGQLRKLEVDPKSNNGDKND